MLIYKFNLINLYISFYLMTLDIVIFQFLLQKQNCFKHISNLRHIGQNSSQPLLEADMWPWNYSLTLMFIQYKDYTLKYQNSSPCIIMITICFWKHHYTFIHSFWLLHICSIMGSYGMSTQISSRAIQICSWHELNKTQYVI